MIEDTNYTRIANSSTVSNQYIHGLWQGCKAASGDENWFNGNNSIEFFVTFIPGPQGAPWKSGTIFLLPLRAALFFEMTKALPLAHLLQDVEHVLSEMTFWLSTELEIFIHACWVIGMEAEIGDGGVNKSGFTISEMNKSLLATVDIHGWPKWILTGDKSCTLESWSIDNSDSFAEVEESLPVEIEEAIIQVA